MSELRKRTPLEEVHEAVFDPETGLKKRVESLEENDDFVRTIKTVLKAVRWPLAILAVAILSSLGTWLAGLLWGAG